MSIPLHYIYHKIRTKYYFNGECGFICFISLICFYKIEQGGLVHVYCVRQLWNALSNNVSIHVESIQICRWSRCKMHSVIIVGICTFYRIKCHKLDLKKMTLYLWRWNRLGLMTKTIDIVVKSRFECKTTSFLWDMENYCFKKLKQKLKFKKK